MADTIYESTVQVIWEPDGAAVLLVDFGDAMWDVVKMDGGQVVQEIEPLRAAGIVAEPRGNERHTLTFTLCRETDGIAAAFEARLERAMQVPRTRADVLIRFSGGDKYRLKNAAVRSWPNDQVEHLTSEAMEIIGGEVVADTGTYTALFGLSDTYYGTSDGDIYDESGGDVYIAP